MDLDKLDRRILYHLSLDSRKSAREIGREVRASKETVNYRIKRLVNKGVINNFFTLMNLSSLGYEYYQVFLKMRDNTPTTDKRIIRFLVEDSNCWNVRSLEGVYEVSFTFIAENPGSMWDFLRRLNEKFGDHITEDSTHTILETYKMHQVFYASRTSRMTSMRHYDIEKNDCDGLDMRIIELTSNNARVKVSDIADRLGEPSQKIAYRMERLRDEGVIVLYSFDMNYHMLDMESIMICISLKDMGSFDNILHFFDATNTSSYGYKLLGRYDISVELQIRNPKMFRDIIGEFKRRFNGAYSDYDIFRTTQRFLLEKPIMPA
ncbi:MAG: winged helix-turn-helix transcriptional regulator [Candidatus Altiarchaeales archaeon]|nr:winged helix-turn-helix transcriptional regulator [Candidatus Altiarchaeales archaeon]MBD3416865.1 winged helix-turn-helix transcriptional regulator [Candidatus Altiarchaeales archaeon]